MMRDSQECQLVQKMRQLFAELLMILQIDQVQEMMMMKLTQPKEHQSKCQEDLHNARN